MSDLVGDMYSSDEWRVHIEDDLRMERTFEHVTEDCQCEGKRCGKCEVVQCVQAFYRKSRISDTLRSECKVCNNAGGKAYRKTHNGYFREKRREYVATYPERVRQQKKVEYQKHSEQHKAKRKINYREKAEYDRAYSRAYKETHPEVIIARSKRYREAHPEYNKKFARLHPGYATIQSIKRRTRKTNAGGSYTVEQWETLKSKYNYTCLCCGKQEPEVKLSADHVIPVTKGGTSNIDNIQPLCRPCNSKKHKKIIDYRKEKMS